MTELSVISPWSSAEVRDGVLEIHHYSTLGDYAPIHESLRESLATSDQASVRFVEHKWGESLPGQPLHELKLVRGEQGDRLEPRLLGRECANHEAYTSSCKECLTQTRESITERLTEQEAQAQPTYEQPTKIRGAARRGLMLRASTGAGGSEMACQVGEALAASQPVPREVVQRIHAWFTEYGAMAKESSGFGNQEAPSSGWIQWLLHGGDTAQAWAAESLGKVAPA